MRKTIVLIVMMTLFFSAGICEAQGNKPPTTKTGATDSTQKLGEAQQDVYEPVVIYQGKWGSGDGEFLACVSGDIIMQGPWTLTTDLDDNIYIFDALNFRILKFANEGKYLGKIDLERQEGKGGLRENIWTGSPNDRLTIDKEDNIYIGGDYGADSVEVVYDKNGKYIKDFREVLDLKDVYLLCIDETGDLYFGSKDKPFIEEEIKTPSGKAMTVKYGYYKVMKNNIEKAYKVPDFKKKPRGIMKDGSYSDGYRIVYVTHISSKGIQYGLYWDEKDQAGGVKILKWIKQE